MNEVVAADWVGETTAFERIRVVTKRTYEPQSADEIASRVLTTQTTARTHLDVLVEDGFVTATSEPDRSATLYRQSAESLVVSQARDISGEVGPDAIADWITDRQAEVREYRKETGADSPEDAAIENVEGDRETFKA